jgi:hypothetical protein
MLSQTGRQKVWALFVVLLLASWGLAKHLEPGHLDYLSAQKAVADPQEKISQSGNEVIDDTPFQALMPMLLGLREVVASLMWVQADDLFHRGEYRPILGLVRRIALIDPHNLDVYATGAWHMAYNFLDRRLVDDGVQFLREGVRNNPHVYDLFFELGYMNYDKTKNFPEAARWYNEGRFKPTTTGKPHAPLYVWAAYCHALQREADIDAAIRGWQEARAASERELKADPKGFVANNSNAAARHNLYMIQRRLNEREATWLEWQGRQPEALAFWKRNIALAEAYLKNEPGRADIRDQDLPTAKQNVERVAAGDLHRGKPRDLHFDFTWKRIKPRVIRVQGTVDILANGRVTIYLKDRDYEQRAARGLDYKMANATLYLDNLVHVGEGKFQLDLKLDQDPAEMGRNATDVFPLKSDQYELGVIFNPRVQSHEVQDRLGWNGEGLTNHIKEYIREDPTRSGTILGQKRPLRYLQKTVILQRGDIV